MELLIFLLLVLLVDLAALTWGLTAEKAEIVPNGNDTETFLSQRKPDERPGGVFNPPGLFEPMVCNGTSKLKAHANEQTGTDFRTTDNSDTHRDRRF